MNLHELCCVDVHLLQSFYKHKYFHIFLLHFNAQSLYKLPMFTIQYTVYLLQTPFRTSGSTATKLCKILSVLPSSTVNGVKTTYFSPVPIKKKKAKFVAVLHQAMKSKGDFKDNYSHCLCFKPQ